MDRQDPQVTILRKQEVASQFGDDCHARIFNFFASTPERNFEMFLMELDGNKGYTSVGHSDKSQEYIMVLEGRLALEVDHQTYHLGQDEAICFSAAQTHHYFSEGEKMMKAMVVNFYPV